MKKLNMIIVAITSVLASGCTIFDKKKVQKTEEYFVSTQSESDDRVRAVNLDKPSEDFSYILDTSKLIFEKNGGEKVETTYKADPEREWILTINTMGGSTFTKSDLEKLFDLAWRQGFPSTIYGFSPEDNKWTFATAGDAPNAFTKLQVGVNLVEVFEAKQGVFDKKTLETYAVELDKRLKKYAFASPSTPSESIEKALAKSKKLVEFKAEFNQEALIVLKNDKPFDGKTAWDALICTGLKWGDGDLLHWENHCKNYGADAHFSVWTTSNPGYFFPEHIANGQMNPSDLVFGFSIPRCADPHHVFEAMINTVSYCQKRLGGTILDRNGQPFDAAKEQKNLLLLIEKMKVEGIVCGSNEALKMF